MDSQTDIHNRRRRLELAIKNVLESEISTSNKDAILSFRDQCSAEGLSTARTVKYINHLRMIAQILKKDFSEADKSDVISIVRKIEEREYSGWTKHDYKVTLKKFYRWLRDSEEYPDEVRWIKTTVRKCKTKLPEELLTEDDVKKLINAADNLRDKALVFALYESGCRISELLSLKLRHVQFDEFGAKFTVSGGKGSRRIRLILSSPSLSQWIANHPLTDDPDAPLWVGFGSKNKNQFLNYPCVNKMLRSLKSRAKLSKPVNPHIFRHSRATILAKNLSEAQLKQIFGWTQSSDMASVYVHLSGRDTDAALLNLYGLKKDKEAKESKLKARKCPRCEHMNPATSRYCGKCTMGLDTKAAMFFDTKMKGLNELIGMVMEHRVNDVRGQDADIANILTDMVCEKMKKEGLVVSHPG